MTQYVVGRVEPPAKAPSWLRRPGVWMGCWNVGFGVYLATRELLGKSPPDNTGLVVDLVQCGAIIVMGIFLIVVIGEKR